jgi:N6-L-threonylcarbamoyladenine synthase
MIILGLETTCDETAASVLETKNGRLAVLSNVVSSQIKLHAKWGGVVPNLAAREHLKNILPVIESALKEAGVSPKEIDFLSVAQGPGLIPALLIGASAAKTLSYLWQKPLLGVHHIEGHIYANFISDNLKFKIKNLKFPILCLVVSGGHTQLVLMENHLRYKIIGETLDDAAGEAFDKVARILGLGYPGGPAVASKAAADHRRHNAEKSGKFQRESASDQRDSALRLPRPMINSKNFAFSFSGLKTAVLYMVKKNPEILLDKKLVADLCAEFQQAVLDVLIAKTLSAAQKYHPQTILLAGGVSANQELRRQLGKAIKNNLPDTKYQIPDTKYSLDNAAMIAAAGFFRWQKMDDKKRQAAQNEWQALQPNANLKIS